MHHESQWTKKTQQHKSYKYAWGNLGHIVLLYSCLHNGMLLFQAFDSLRAQEYLRNFAHILRNLLNILLILYSKELSWKVSDIHVNEENNLFLVTSEYIIINKNGKWNGEWSQSYIVNVSRFIFRIR